MFNFFNDAFNYEDRKVRRDEINGLVVSTVYTSDEGYETAILDSIGAHPVERYSSKEEAEIGHKNWCIKAETLEKITELGRLNLVKPRELILVK